MWEKDGSRWWYKNGKLHREDGSADIWKDGYKQWWLDGGRIWSSDLNKIDLKNHIVLSKDSHPKYFTVQVWKWLDKNRIQEQVINPGMKEYITE